MEEIVKRLWELQDEKYREFQSSLCPTVEPERMIGVRTPLLKKLAKEIAREGKTEAFLAELPHLYFEENQLHAFLLSERKEYDELIKELNAFLPVVDNWATCDQLRPKIFKKQKHKLREEIERWLDSGETYVVRFGIEMLMTHFLEEEFREEDLERVSQIQSAEYYVNMMIAWYFATALAKQPEAAFPYMKEKRLAAWVHKKTIQKARESFRVSEEMKEALKQLC